jgi:hypothetical protein
MHNWLIFQYHRARAKSKSRNVGAVPFGERTDRVAGG